MSKNEVVVKGINVNYKKINQTDYICITDIVDCLKFFSLWLTIKENVQ